MCVCVCACNSTVYCVHQHARLRPPSPPDGSDPMEKAFRECPLLKKFYEAHKDKDGSLNVKMTPEQAKPLCAEFKSTDSKCRSNAVVGQFLGGLCGSSTDICSIALNMVCVFVCVL